VGVSAKTLRVQALCDIGLSEDVALAALQREERRLRLSQDVVVGGALDLAAMMPDTAHVVHPILVSGQLTAMTAHPGAGKSTACIGIAFAYVLRRRLGPLDPRGDGLAYFVSAEDAAGTRLRVYAEAIRNELDAGERATVNERLRWVHVNTHLRAEIILEHIATDAEGRSIALVFVDTGPATFAGDEENSNTDQQAHASAWRRGTELPGKPCVVVLGHPHKGATADNLTPRGGSAFLGSLDANLTIWKDDDVITISHTKLRSEHFEPLTFRLDPVAMQLDSGAHVTIPVIAAIADESAGEVDNRQARRREAMLLAMRGAPGPLSVRELAQRIGSRRSTVQRDFAAMAAGRHPLIRKNALTDQHELTPEGIKAAAQLVLREANAYRESSNGA
jgi:hypothetical protein